MYVLHFEFLKSNPAVTDQSRLLSSIQRRSFWTIQGHSKRHSRLKQTRFTIIRKKLKNTVNWALHFHYNLNLSMHLCTKKCAIWDARVRFFTLVSDFT